MFWRDFLGLFMTRFGLGPDHSPAGSGPIIQVQDQTLDSLIRRGHLIALVITCKFYLVSKVLDWLIHEQWSFVDQGHRWPGGFNKTRSIVLIAKHHLKMSSIWQNMGQFWNWLVAPVYETTKAGQFLLLIPKSPFKYPLVSLQVLFIGLVLLTSGNAGSHACHSRQTPNLVFRVLSIPYTLALKATSIAVVLDHHAHPYLDTLSDICRKVC